MNLLLLRLLGVGAVGIVEVCLPCSTAGLVSGGTPPLATTMPIRAHASDTVGVTLAISGMTCGGCAIAARKTLTRLDGVVKADVNYETRRATVVYDRAKVDVARMIAAVRKLGYSATVVAP